MNDPDANAHTEKSKDTREQEFNPALPSSEQSK